MLKGLPLDQALAAASLSSKKGAYFIAKLLKSMTANLAEKKMSGDDFHIEQVAVEQGPTLKRFWSRSRGMARPITKRTSHIRMVVADSKEGKE